MFQKEVALRIIGNEKTSNYSRIGIITKARFEILDHFHISKNCFYPKPKVDSTLIVLKPIINSDVKFKKIENLEKITSIFFSNKRKMINKNLKKIVPKYLSIKNLKNINPKSRPEELTAKNYFDITENYEKL